MLTPVRFHLLAPSICALLLLWGAAFGGGISAAPTAAYPQPQPSNQEQHLLELINAARANPAAEGQMLAAVVDADILSYYQHYAVSTSQLVSDFNGYTAKPPLAFNADLMTSSREQSLDQAANGYQGHTSSDGTTWDQRINNTGYQWSGAGENVYAMAQDPFFAHVGLMVDWGVPLLEHRVNLLNLDPSVPNFREIGISAVPASNPAVGPLVVTEDFGTPADAGTAYLVGVVYNDANGNGAYDEGEGLAGVTITPDGTSYYAVTTASGGYVIPLPASGSGSLKITASGGPFTADRVQTVNYVAGTNVKVDFTTAPTAGMALPVVTLSATKVIAAADSSGPGVFTLTLSAVQDHDVVVNFTIKGSAVNGTDYVLLKTSKKIKAGKTSKSIKVTPLGTGNGTVLLTLQPATSYTVGTTGKVKVKIAGQ